MQWRSTGDGRRVSAVVPSFCVFAVIVSASPQGSAQDPAALMEDSVIKIVETTEGAVVSIARFTPSLSERRKNAHHALGRHDREPIPDEMELLPNEFGAGVLISPPKSTERLVLTNYHIVRGGAIDKKNEADRQNYDVDNGTTLHIHFADRRRCLAVIVAADPRSDLAVLRVQWDKSGIKQADYPTLNWESAASARKGQFVVLLGNPHAVARDGSASVSWGIISNLTRQPITLNRDSSSDHEELAEKSMLNRLGTMMQLDARLNLGTSGGPVLNLKGELIALSTSLAAIEGYDQSAGFAFPIDAQTRRIVQTLLNGQEVEYGMIGIEPQTVSPEEFGKLNTGLRQRSAARVSKVRIGSPADVGGIIAKDIIVAVDGEPVRSDADLMRLVSLHPPEDIITITLWRKDPQFELSRLESVRIKLIKWPVRDDAGIIETNPRYAPWRGLSVDYSTARTQLSDSMPFDSGRVLVTKVAEDSRSHAARLQPGDFITHVNKIAVQNPAAFHAAVKSAPGTVTLTLCEPSATAEFSTRLVQVRE